MNSVVNMHFKCAFAECGNRADTKWNNSRNGWMWVCKAHIEFLQKVHDFRIINGEYYTVPYGEDLCTQ